MWLKMTWPQVANGASPPDIVTDGSSTMKSAFWPAILFGTVLDQDLPVETSRTDRCHYLTSGEGSPPAPGS